MNARQQMFSDIAPPNSPDLKSRMWENAMSSQHQQPPPNNRVADVFLKPTLGGVEEIPTSSPYWWRFVQSPLGAAVATFFATALVLWWVDPVFIQEPQQNHLDRPDQSARRIFILAVLAAIVVLLSPSISNICSWIQTASAFTFM